MVSNLSLPCCFFFFPFHRRFIWLSLHKSLRFWFKHQSIYTLKSHCSILFFHAKYSHRCAAPGLFTVNYQPATPLSSPISWPIVAASEALMCGLENMVNNIIAALSRALMLREKERGASGRPGVCRGHASDLQKSQQTPFLLRTQVLSVPETYMTVGAPASARRKST